MAIWRTMTDRKGGSIRRIKTIFMVCMMGIVFEGPPLNDYCAFSQEEGGTSVSTGKFGSMDFNDCIKLALEQSPYFKENALEIDVRRLDESDSRWAFIPSLTIRTTSYMGLEDDSGMKINIILSEYDPLASYLTLKASKIFTEIAILIHQKSIADGIYDMAKKFLELENLGQIAVFQEQVLDQHLENVSFFQARHKAGVVTQVEVQLAQGQLAVAKAEREYISAQQASIMEGLRQFLSLDSSQRLDANLQEIRHQALGPHAPADYSLEQAQNRSFELRIHELKNELQNYKISQAYAKFVPKLTMGVHQTTDLDATQVDDYYYSLSFRMNLWNGFKDVNDVTRQKIILNKYKNETRLVEIELNTEWQTTQRALSESEAAFKLARLNEEMLGLKVQQNEVHYSSNKKPLSALLNSRIAHLEAWKDSLKKTLEHDKKTLKIRHLSGDLFESFIKVSTTKE